MAKNHALRMKPAKCPRPKTVKQMASRSAKRSLKRR